MKRLALGMVALLACTVASSQQEVTGAQQWLAATKPLIQEQHSTKNGSTYVRLPQGFALPGSDLGEKTQYLLDQLLPVLELSSTDDEFRLMSQKEDVAGNHHLKLQHYHAGIPVFDGYLQLHLDPQEQLQAVHGRVISDIRKVETVLDPEEAFQRALVWMGKHHPGADLQQLEIEKELLTWYPEGIAEGRLGPVRLAYEISLANRMDIRERR